MMTTKKHHSPRPGLSQHPFCLEGLIITSIYVRVQHSRGGPLQIHSFLGGVRGFPCHRVLPLRLVLTSILASCGVVEGIVHLKHNFRGCDCRPFSPLSYSTFPVKLVTQ